MKDEIRLHIFSADPSTILEQLFANGSIKVGFPIPCQNYMSEKIDLNKEIIRHNETTFLAKVFGNSLMDAGISDGDIIVIDKSLEVNDGDFVVAYIDGEFTLKKFKSDKANNCAWLIHHNDNYSPIKVTEGNDFIVWGVMTYSIKRLDQ